LKSTGKSSLTISVKPDGVGAVSQTRIKGRFIVRTNEKRTAFLELLHVLLSAQIKIGHATVWMRTRVCVSFILRPSLLPFGFAPWFARILRETFTGLQTLIAATESASLCVRMNCNHSAMAGFAA
jgi:hypothetical protein